MCADITQFGQGFKFKIQIGTSFNPSSVKFIGDAPWKNKAYH